jgi:hypothetical protein
MNGLEEKLNALEERLDEILNKLGTVGNSLDNLGMIIQNGLASRMFDMVTPLGVLRHDADGNLEIRTEPQRNVRWYWKLHN